MPQSNFDFIREKWPKIYEEARKAEENYPDDPVSCTFFSARRCLERVIKWVFDNDRSYRHPYENTLDAYLKDPVFNSMVEERIKSKLFLLKALGNRVSHAEDINQDVAQNALKELYHILYWLYRNYGNFKTKNNIPTEMNFQLLKPLTTPVKKVVIKKSLVQKLNDDAEKQDQEEEREKEAQLKSVNLVEHEKEIARLKAEIENLKKNNLKQPDEHDYKEDDTRKYLIDLLLYESGWDIHEKDATEYEVHGMPNDSGIGYADYVLWGRDGLPLAVVEAKRSQKDPASGKQQAKLYADCLEQMKGQRPIIFYTNGYTTYIWDDKNYPPRKIQGFYNRDELQGLINRRKDQKDLKTLEIPYHIAGRTYQQEAIRRVAEQFVLKKRKSLIVMATGAGKTRTAIALVDLLMRSLWAKRILFLADRRELVRQARNAFLKFLPNTNPEIITGKAENTGRIALSTYQTMMNCINILDDKKRKFTVGHFDLVIIDEAHRSVYHKYGAIFDYFDSLLVGLTATPKNEVDRNTYQLFDLDDGNPTYYYELDQAIKDGVLVPPKAISVELKFQREGIKYADLSPEEQEEYEVKLYNEDTGEIPDKIDSSALNEWLFNKDTVDKVLKQLMEQGLKVESGDRLGKTIIFAKNHKHAEFIVERFDKNYPHLKGLFCQLIDNTVQNSDTLIDDFKTKPNPVIAVSVDMLDTGVDIPEILNLVFFKMVRSKTKFHQMIGRGTRLCENLLGPKNHKQYFVIFDYCQNFEFFEQFPDGLEPRLGESLSKRLFKSRLNLVVHLQNSEDQDSNKIRDQIIHGLKNEVHRMNPDNFIVRPKRELLDKFKKDDVWKNICKEDEMELSDEIAGLPSEIPPEKESAKLFDLLLYQCEFAFLTESPKLAGYISQIQDIARNLEQKRSIPQVDAQSALLNDLVLDEFWQDITLPAMEHIRVSIRDLVQYIDRIQQPVIETNFIDSLGDSKEIDYHHFGSLGEFNQYRIKVEKFIKDREDHLVIYKIKNNKQITEQDLMELENLLFSAGEVESREKFEEVFGRQDRLGIFIRKLIGLDRVAAKEAFSDFLSDKTLNSTQISFIDQIIDYLTRNGIMEPGILYDPPFTQIHDQGISGVFHNEKVMMLVNTIQKVQEHAVVDRIGA